MLTRRWPRSFADRVTGPLPGPPQFFRLWREGVFAGSTEGVARIPVAAPASLPAGDSWLVWLGHASFLLRLSGCTVAVDPCCHNGSWVQASGSRRLVWIGYQHWICF